MNSETLLTIRQISDRLKKKYKADRVILFGSYAKGEKKTEQEIIEIIKDMKMEDATFNIVGEKSINAAIKAELISEDSVRKIQGIPFVLVLM